MDKLEKPFLSLDHERASKAWKLVESVYADSKIKGDYHALIRDFPSQVQRQGIGQSVAFLLSRLGDKGAHQVLLHHLRDWLFDSGNSVPWSTPRDKYLDPDRGLFERLLAERDPQVWWRADQEAIDFCLWLKQFSESRQ
jgi:CRISPR type III-B/RAMP module-associated protein Cmr5